MKSLFLATAALAALAVPTIASAEQVRLYDPAEGEFVTVEVNPASANATAAAADAQRYTRTIRVYDPAEGEFATVRVGEAPAVIATHDETAADRPMKRMYDPAESEWISVPAN